MEKLQLKRQIGTDCLLSHTVQAQHNPIIERIEIEEAKSSGREPGQSLGMWVLIQAVFAGSL